METLIDDRKIVVHDLLVELMEDIAMVRVIQDGENSGQARYFSNPERQRRLCMKTDFRKSFARDLRKRKNDSDFLDRVKEAIGGNRFV